MAASFAFAVAVYCLWALVGAAQWLGLIQPTRRSSVVHAERPIRSMPSGPSAARARSHTQAA
jgi:hypothetical protein